MCYFEKNVTTLSKYTFDPAENKVTIGWTYKKKDHCHVSYALHSILTPNIENF